MVCTGVPDVIGQYTLSPAAQRFGIKNALVVIYLLVGLGTILCAVLPNFLLCMLVVIGFKIPPQASAHCA